MQNSSSSSICGCSLVDSEVVGNNSRVTMDIEQFLMKTQTTSIVKHFYLKTQIKLFIHQNCLSIKERLYNILQRMEN